MVAALVVLAVGVAACTARAPDDGRNPPAPTPAIAASLGTRAVASDAPAARVPGSTPTSSQALALCQSAMGPRATVTAAFATTVEEVRERHGRGGGTPPVEGPSPVVGDADWDSLPGDAGAAWCAVTAGSAGYEITAVAQGARMVAFVTSSEPRSLGPNGPNVP